VNKLFNWLGSFFKDGIETVKRRASSMRQSRTFLHSPVVDGVGGNGGSSAHNSSDVNNNNNNGNQEMQSSSW